jgi:hypothetical protein
MRDVELSGCEYRVGNLPVIDQFHLARKLTPIMAGIAGKDEGDVLAVLSGIMGEMSVEDSNFILFGLLKCVSKKLEGGIGWAPIAKGQTLMYNDIILPDLIKLAFEALQENLGSFLPGLHAAGNPGK